MGYNTQYQFTTIDAPSVDTFKSKLWDVVGGEIDECDTCKWYEHDKDISAAMVATGATLVLLHGEGEEQGDVWDKEYRLVDGAVTIKTFRYRLVRDTEPT